ncbi:MAG: exo-alpha-sialidase, partial [Gemmataceae bacterium]|nr:exo-alpha-sialidase [Gemmataceae bacterium]
EMMPSTFLGPVRAKPIQLANGTILAGTSWESYKNWVPFVDRSADDGKTWKRSNPFPVPEKFNQIQPALFEAKDGKVVALMRSRNPRVVCRAESKDGGETFSAAEETKLPNPSTGVDCVKTKDGDVFLICNPVEQGRTPLSIAHSTDDGKTWKKVKDLEAEPGEYSYPAMILSSAGKLEITYTWKRTHIKYLSLDPKDLRS